MRTRTIQCLAERIRRNAQGYHEGTITYEAFTAAQHQAWDSARAAGVRAEVAREVAQAGGGR